MDDPCLTRTKDGSQLIADFGNSQCYAQKATNTIVYLKWDDGAGNHTNGSTYSYTSPLTTCHDTLDYSYTIGQSGMIAGICIEKERIYTADPAWIKLNDTIQEYRESF